MTSRYFAGLNITIAVPKEQIAKLTNRHQFVAIGYRHPLNDWVNSRLCFSNAAWGLSHLPK